MALRCPSDWAQPPKKTVCAYGHFSKKFPYESGRLVRHKADGRLMAVVKADGQPDSHSRTEPLVECIWMEGRDFKRGIFKAADVVEAGENPEKH